MNHAHLLICMANLHVLDSQGVFFYYIATYVPVKYGAYEYPMWAEALGLMISGSSMICVPGYVIYYALSRPGSILEVRLT